jgi:hypothetical protein
MMLLPAAFIVSLMPIVRTMRDGGRLLAHPLNLVLAVVIFVFIAALVGGVIADQYPRWIGVANYD